MRQVGAACQQAKEFGVCTIYGNPEFQHGSLELRIVMRRADGVSGMLVCGGGPALVERVCGDKTSAGVELMLQQWQRIDVGLHRCRAVLQRLWQMAGYFLQGVEALLYGCIQVGGEQFDALLLLIEQQLTQLVAKQMRGQQAQ